MPRLPRLRSALPRRIDADERAELTDHLGELRTRLLIVGAALAICAGAAYAVHGDLIAMLNVPLGESVKRPVTYGVAEPFLVSLKVSLMAGLAFAMPIVLWQFWSFVAPAVGRPSRRLIVGIASVATALFAGGLAFGYLVALPAAVKFLTTFDAHLYDIQVRANDYYPFAAMVLVAIALVFELPVLVVGLVRLGVISSRKLRDNRRIGYVAVAALAILLPGVDPVTAAIEMAVLIVLFEVSIWISVLVDKRETTRVSRWLRRRRAVGSVR